LTPRRIATEKKKTHTERGDHASKSLQTKKRNALRKQRPKPTGTQGGGGSLFPGATLGQLVSKQGPESVYILPAVAGGTVGVVLGVCGKGGGSQTAGGVQH